jgi:hypothetical protein
MDPMNAPVYLSPVAHPLRSSSLRRAAFWLGLALVLFGGACAPDKLTPEQYYGGTPPEDVAWVDLGESPDAESDTGTTEPADATPIDELASDDALSDDATGFDVEEDAGATELDVAATPEVAADLDGAGGDAPSEDLGGIDAADDIGASDATVGDVEAPDVESVDATVPDTSTCVPQCINKFCGDDGCGGICGNCGDTKYCSTSFKCIPKCIPQCFKKLCGPDQCGGSCGTCNVGFECGADGKCYDTTCTPNCEGRVCGDDGCEGSCGQCAPGDLCDGGQCVLGPCSGVPFDTGKCEAGMAKLCIGSTQLIVKDCTSLVDKKCGWNPQIPAYDCIAATECFPTCLNKECGDDGCGGLCGSCPPGWPCAAGACIPTTGGGCGYYNTVGTCDNDVLWYCEAQMLQREDCSLVGKSCQFNPTVPANQCL